MEVNLFLKKVLLLLLSTLVGILSGCSAGKLSVPSGILATDQTVADEYMTDNSFCLQDMVQITQSHLLAEAVRVKSINQVNQVLCRFNT